jgi:peroxiredoxin
MTLRAAEQFPDVTVPKAGGGDIALGKGEGWRMVVVYRGQHCPVCRTYLRGLNEMLDDFAQAGVNVAAVSADTKDKAEKEIAEENWRFPVAYGLSIDQMKTLGLYISDPRSPQETDRPFPEPGLFVVNPRGQLQIIDISNAPFSRPDLKMVLKGLKFIQEKDYPVRGTHA